MKKIKFYVLTFSLIVFLFFSLIGCNSTDDSTQTSKVSIRMTDAPGDYDAVFIDVQDVLIKTATDDEDNKGWVSLGGVTPKVYKN